MSTSGAYCDVDFDFGPLFAEIDRFKKRGGNLAPTMSVCAEIMVSAVNDRFAAQGPGWQELAESTLAKRRGTTAIILQDTGRFAGSIQPSSGADWAEAGTDVSYSVYHVSDEPRSVIPLRNPFDIGDAPIEECAQLVLEAIAS